jgi:hypothetical protein
MANNVELTTTEKDKQLEQLLKIGIKSNIDASNIEIEILPVPISLPELTQEKEQPRQEKEQPTQEKEQPTQEKEQPTQEKEQPTQEKEQPTEEDSTEKEINEWSLRKQLTIEKLLYKLKYNRAINNYFFFSLKSKENFWSWTIIVISTAITGVNLLNNFEEEPFIYFFVIIKIILIIFPILVTLIAAWIKKQQYVDRINLIDRYNQKINKLIEEIDVQLVLLASDREKYTDFKKKYQSQITEYLSTSPAMSPQEWKRTVYHITIYYPELIDNDNSDQNKLWPWFAASFEDNRIIRKETNFGNNIKRTYWALNPCNKLKNCLFFCCKQIDLEKGEKS